MALFSRFRLRSHTRLFLIFIVTFIVPLVILTVIFLQSYRTIYNNEVQQSALREMESTTTIIDAQLQTASNYISMISQNQDLKSHLTAALDSGCILSDNTPSLQKIIQGYGTGQPLLLNFQVIIMTSDGTTLLGKEQQRYIDTLYGSEEFKSFLQTTYSSPLKSAVWFSDQKLRNCSANEAYILVVHPITDSLNREVIGHAILRFRNSDIISMYLQNSKPYRSIFILDSSGGIISSIDNLQAKDSLLIPYASRILLSNEPLMLQGSLVCANKFFNLWQIVSMTEIDAIARTQLNVSVSLYIAALLLCIIITLVVSFFTSKHFMEPIHILTSRMQEVEKGDFHSRAIIKTHDEFEDLANSYNKMIQRVEDLMRQIIFEQEQKRESDIRMLQAQINPHFLYNTLASIRYMIHVAPPKETDQILLALCRFLKYVLSNAENVYATLDREFEQLNDYITIQRVGFDVPLQYQVDVEEGLGHCLIVKMLFQPLIENAILHGLKLNKTNPTLQIKVSSIDSDQVEICICDNGAGFDTAALSVMPSKKSSHHLGIANVQQRLWLHYGKSGDLDIQSTRGKGTTVRICIPKLTEEDMRNENPNR